MQKKIAVAVPSAYDGRIKFEMIAIPPALVQAAYVLGQDQTDMVQGEDSSYDRVQGKQIWDCEYERTARQVTGLQQVSITNQAPIPPK